jgi:hypothetical protein
VTPLIVGSRMWTYIAKGSDFTIADSQQKHVFSTVIHPSSNIADIGEVRIGQINGY